MGKGKVGGRSQGEALCMGARDVVASCMCDAKLVHHEETVDPKVDALYSSYAWFVTSRPR
eukprot:129033-Chlamydomonas_euryale.AAC.3